MQRVTVLRCGYGQAGLSAEKQNGMIILSSQVRCLYLYFFFISGRKISQRDK